MQRSLLPQVRPAVEGLDVGEVYAASARVDVGGDLYDYMALPDGRLAVVLGDVTGHGIDAAADMAMAKFVFRSLAREHPEPGDFLAAANEVVVGEIAPGKFITMLYLLIDAATGSVSVASAGHPPPRLVGPDGSVVGIEARGLALGVDSGIEYAETRAQLEPAGSVVLYTDGVIEARRSAELYGPGPARRAARASPRAARGGHRSIGDPVRAAVHGRRTPRRLRGRRAEAPGVTDRRSLYALVFLAGVGTLATEICASRLLAPYYGSSTIVWANIIGLTLASLSLGYWLGGRLADRNPSPHVLGRIVLAAALLVAADPVRVVADPRRRLERPRRGLRRRRDRLVLRDAAALRAGDRPARDGRAVRDPPRARRGLVCRTGRRAPVRGLDVGQPARDVPAGSRSRSL